MTRNLHLKRLFFILAGILCGSCTLVLAADEERTPTPPTAEQKSEAPTAPAASQAVQKAGSRLVSLAASLNFGADNVELVWLGQEGEQYLALFQAAAEANAHGAVITILAGGKIVENSEFSRSIRQTLSAANWASLVVQTEAMRTGKASLITAEQVQKLLSEALAYISQQNYSKFVVVADGEVASHLWPQVQEKSPDVIGFVGLDKWDTEEFAPTIPVLNVVNSSVPNAVTNARKRFNAVKQKPSAPCEVHFYAGSNASDKGYGHLVSRRIRGWLQRKFADAG